MAGHITTATFKLAYRADAHTAVGLTLLLAGAAVFAVGSTVMARPFVRRRLALLVAVPIAAVAGMLVLGVLAIIVVFIVSEAGDILTGIGDPGFGGGGGTKRRDRHRSKKRG